MGFLTSLWERRGSPENPSTNLSDPSSWLIDWAMGGRQSATGKTVTEDTALAVSTVYSCVRVLAESVGSLPLHIYRRLPKGKEIARTHPLYPMLHTRPNRRQTSVFFRETMQGHAALWGNAYAYIERTNGGHGAPVSIVPVDPRKVVAKVDSQGDAFYVYTSASGATETWPGHQVLHIPALGSDGVSGLRPMALLKDAVGLAMATEEHGGRLFSNGARPGGILTSPTRLTQAQRDQLRTAWEAQHQGVGKSSSVALLEGGLTWTAVGIPPDDAQFLETRKFQVLEIARIFRVPPHMVGDLERATFSNIEEQGIEFVVYTLRPWLVRWEQELNAKLFDDGEEYFAEFSIDGLLRGNIATRYTAYATGRSNGWLSVNDIRTWENLNPVGPEGDVLIVPMNMVPLDQLGEVPEPAPPATEPPPEDPDDDEPVEPAEDEPADEEPADPEAAAAPPAAEVRRAQHLRSVASRRRAARAARHAVLDAAQRVARHEVRAIRRIAAKVFGKSRRGEATALTTWGDQVAEFYDEFAPQVTRTMRPALRSLIENVAALASGELPSTHKSPDDLDARVEKFVNDYTEALGVRHSARSRAQMKGIAADLWPDEDAITAAIDERLDSWETSRPDKMADDELARAGNGAAWLVWAAAAVAIVWYASGPDACDICSGMDGTVVGTDESFAGPADPAVSDDTEGQNDIRPRSVVRHPPLHDGCECDIGPG